MNKTIQEVFDTLTKDQKQKVYCLIGDAIKDPESTIKSSEVNLDFLSNNDQKTAVKAILITAIGDYYDNAYHLIVNDLPENAGSCLFSKYWNMTNKYECIFKRGMYCICSLENNEKCPYLLQKED